MKTVKIGSVGLGRLGYEHAKNLATQVPGCELAAICDVDAGRVKEVAEELGVQYTYTDFEEMCKNPELDAIVIVSPSFLHCQQIEIAMNNGKHVFCEKPVDHSIEKIQAVADALKEHPDIKFQVGFNRRFDHNFAAIRKAYDDGKIGEAHILKITSRDPEPPNPAYIKVSGGIFLDMTIHDFDMACFLTDSDVEELYVNSAVLVDPAIGEQGDVDTAIITMKMANGALAVIDNSRKAAYGYDQRAELFGSKGMVATSNDTVSSAVISNADGVTGEKPLFFFLERYMGSFSEEMRQFTEAVINDTEVPVGIHAGLQSVKIGLAARKSVEEHRPVKISEIQ